MPRAFLIKKHSPARESGGGRYRSSPGKEEENLDPPSPMTAPISLDLAVPASDKTDGRGPFDLTVKNKRNNTPIKEITSSVETMPTPSSVIEFCPKIVTPSTTVNPPIGVALTNRRTPSPKHSFKPVTPLEPLNPNTPPSSRTPPWHRPFVPPPYPPLSFPLYPLPRHASVEFYSSPPTYIGSPLISPPLVTLSPPRSALGIDQLSPCTHIRRENVSPTAPFYAAAHSIPERLHLEQHVGRKELGPYRSQTWIHKEGSTSPISRSDSSDSGVDSTSCNKISPDLINSTVSVPSGQPPRYQCVDCKKSYSTYSGLSRHRQFHCVTQTKKSFNCKYCDKMYVSLGALKMHIRSHTLPCKCRLCGKAFSRPWLLEGHIRTHTGEKPFACHHCSRAFADRSNLRAHLQTHSDVKKYSCKTCSKTFSRMSLLLKHTDGGCLATQQR